MVTGETPACPYLDMAARGDRTLRRNSVTLRLPWWCRRPAPASSWWIGKANTRMIGGRAGSGEFGWIAEA